MAKKAKWKKLDSNEVLDGDGFYISYNPDLSTTGAIVPMFSATNNADETALVHRTQKPQFLILNGDFRKEYEEALPRGYEACRAVYESHRAVAASKWSEDTPDDEAIKFVMGRLLGGADDE